MSNGKFSRKNKKNRMRDRKKRKQIIPFHPVPKSMLVKMRYTSQITVNPTIGTAAGHVYRCNSIFDPDQTGVGAQPYGHDTYQTLYQHYRVVGSSCKATFIANATSPSGSAVVGVRTDTDTTINTGPAFWWQLPDVSHTYLGESGGSAAVREVTKNFSTRKWFGKKSTTVANAGADFGGNPSNQVYYHVMVSPADGASDIGQVVVNVLIDYIVLLTDRIDLNES